MLQRCLYGKPVYQYIMDYAVSFWETYPDLPKFFMAYIPEAHEWTGELVQYMDDPLTRFLKSLETAVSQDTTIFLLSDHGNHLNGIYRLLKSEGPELEMKTPLMHILRRKTAKNDFVRQNYFKLVSMFDVHKTIVEVLNGNREKIELAEVKAYNIFDENVPGSRSCHDAGIIYDPHCICPNLDNQRSRTFPISS